MQAAPPKLNYLFPAGAQRGAEVTVTAQGDFAIWPVQAWVDRPGVSIKADAEKGKLRIVVDKTAPPGVCWVRLFDAAGASSLRPFVIDQVPEAAEVEPNDAPDKGQVVALPHIINGRLGKAGDVDAFAVTLKQGETLVASVRAHSVLGSPLDGALQICELRERKFSSIAGSPTRLEAFVLEQNNDTFGLDPQVALTAPRDGTYLVRVFAFSAEPNSSINYAGGDNYIYRLTLTTGGLVEYALPVSAAADVMHLFGTGLAAPGVPGERTTPAAGAVVHLFADGVAGTAVLPTADKALLARAGEPQPISVERPVTIAGQLAVPGESHAFRLSAKKGQAIDVRLQSRSLGLPLDAVLKVEDAAGKTLQQVDDVAKRADPSLTFTAAADGDYLLRVRDLHRRGGPRFAYWLSVQATTPRFTLALAADNITIAPGKTVEVPVTVDRQGGHKAEIAVTAIGESGALPPGISIAPATSAATGDTAKAVKLVLTAAADAPPGGFCMRIVGRVADVPGETYAQLPSTFPLTTPPAAPWLTIAPP